MASVVQLLLAALWTLLGTALRSRAETSSSEPPPPPPSAAVTAASSNSSEAAPEPRVQAARETHMAAAGASDASASHPLLTLVLVLGLGSVSIAAAIGLRRVFRRLFFRDRLGSYRYYKVNQDDDGELMAVEGGYHVALDDSSEDELGPARLPVNTPEAAQVRRSCLSPPPEAKSLLLESSDEELLQ